MSDEQPNGLSGAINDAMAGANFDEPSGDSGNPNPAPDKPADSSASDQTPASTWDKVERRKAAATNDDPEVELDYEEEAGKGKAKAKLSELKSTAKFMFDNRKSFGSTLRIREEAGKNPAFGKLLDTIISKAYEGGNYNQQFVDTQLSSLEAKKVIIQDKIDDTVDEIKDAEDALNDLDPDSAQAKALRKSISFMRNARTELQNTKKSLTDLQTKVDGIDKFKTDFESNKQKEVHQVEVKRLSSVYDTEIGALTSADKKDSYKFIDDDEKKDFDSSVRSMVAQADKDGKIKGEEDFVKAIRESAKFAYERMSKRREAYVSDYLRKKTGGKTEEPPKKEEPPKTMDFHDMGKALADAGLAG